MPTNVEESNFEELIDYLNGLIRNAIYPLAYQAKGKYEAKDLKLKIKNIYFSSMNGTANEERYIENQKQEGNINEIAEEICEAIWDSLIEVFISKTTGDFFMISFSPFKNDIVEKITKIAQTTHL
jgi:hypothetical protein